MEVKVGQEFRVFMRHSQPFLAWRAGPLSVTEALSAMPLPTWKRRWYARSLGLQLAMGLNGQGFTRCDDPLIVPFGLTTEALVKSVSTLLGESSTLQLISWSTNPLRPRAYCLVVSDGRKRYSFLKISCWSHSSTLDTEAETLVELDGTHGGFVVPRLLGRLRTEGSDAIVTTAVPAGSRAASRISQNILFSLTKRRDVLKRNVVKLDELTWWTAWNEGKKGTEFISAMSKKPVQTGRIHGDLTAANVLRNGAASWLVDWEMSRPDAPLWVDAVTHAWPTRTGMPTRHGHKSIGVAARNDPANTVAAIAFLAAHGHQGAALYFEREIRTL